MSKQGLRFARENPHIVEASQAFIQKFDSVPDPVVKVASLAEDEEAQIAWVLLGSVVYHGLTYLQVLSVLEALFKEFPNKKLWETPVPKASDLKLVIKKALNNESWALLEHAPGMFWSVGFFVRRHFPLMTWLDSRTEEELWRDLGEIYFMGKKNIRPKVISAILRIKNKAPLGLGFSVHEEKAISSFPLSMGSRRFMGFIGPGKEGDFADWTPEKKLEEVNGWYKIVSPKAMEKAAHGFSFFLEPGQNDFLCREIIKSCEACPLYCNCSYGRKS